MKNQVIGAFEEVVEQGGQAAKQNAQAFVKAATGQVTGDQGTNEQAAKQQTQMSDDQAKQFLTSLYGKTSDDKSEQSPKTDSKVEATPEELVKIETLRKQLHQDYYQALVNPPKQKEERPAEKVEREEKEERWELVQKQKEKPPELPPNLKQGTGEKVVGVSG